MANALGLTGVLALGFWLVKGSLDAMRVGLLTRFMGVMGIALGPALVLGFGLLVLPLWLVALGVLFLGRWPRGMPPAWITGRAEPWQSAGDAPAARRAAERRIPAPGATARWTRSAPACASRAPSPRASPRAVATGRRPAPDTEAPGADRAAA